MQTQFTNRLRSNASWRMSALALLIAVLTWLAAPQSALAATFTVTKPADTNDGACNADCSLREAIIAANASPGADVITLPAGTYTLSRSGVDNNATNGDLDVTGPLTINGAAQATTIIQAGTSSATAIDRLFSFNPLGSATGFAVSLNNLTLRNGRNSNAFATQESDGGCFDFDAGTAGTGSLSLTNVTVSNCETTDGSGGGFVIFFPVGGTATLNNITVQNNSATRPAATSGLGNGGGFMVGGAGGPATLTINNSLIDNNQALKTGTTISSIGGGIAIGGRSNPSIATNYQIHGTRITNNQAAGDGGGIHSLSPLTIDNVGGVALFGNNQTGNNGGGLFLRHPSQTTNINKVAFTGNSAVNLGGGIRSSNGDGQALNVSFSRFVNNTAASGKGSGLSTYTAAVNAANNWWGCSTGPTASPCDTAQLDIDNTNPAGTLTAAPWLRLNLTAATNPLVTGQSTGLTASFLTNSTNGAVALSNLDVLLTLPVTWSSVGGTLSGQQTTIQSNGTATANYQATAAAAGNQAVAKVDNDGTTTGSNVRALTVNKANTTPTITADTPDPSVAGQAVTVSYNVTVNSPGAGTVTGNVTVSDGVNSCTGTVAAGSCSIALITVGVRTLTATYAGDANFNSSTSAGAAHTVSQGTTTTAITADTPDPSVVGQPVVVQYTVTPQGSGTPTGNVTVSDGTVSCTGTVAAGQCSLALTSVGAKTLTATYAGDANFNGSTSSSATHTVNKADTTTTITADTPDPSTVGQAVTVSYNVTVNAPGAGTPTGNVTVSDGVDSCTATAAAGTCSLTLTTIGARALTATYAGDSNFNSSTSAGADHTVNPATQAPQITSQPTAHSVCAGATATFSAAANGAPAPTVQWQVSTDNGATWNDLSGETNATVNVVTSAADNGKQYRAVFSNSAGSATSDAATLTVNSAPVISTQPGNQTVNEGQSVSFSTAASGSPTPTVQWQVSTDSGATWNDLAGETDTTLTFTAQSGDNGKQFRAVFTNGCSSAPSNAATLTVNVPDTTAPVITAQVNGTLGNNGWYVSDVTVSWSVVDDESTISSQDGCDAVNVTGDTSGVTFTCSATSAGGSSSESVTVKRDKSAPSVLLTGVTEGATYNFGSVPTAACSTTDALSGVATQATLSITGGNPDGSGSFTATCSGATDLAGNSTAAVSVSYTVTTLINSSVSQQSASSSYNATPQACPSIGGTLPIQSITPTLRNISSITFSDLFFRVKTLEYTKNQGGQQPTLCNATGGTGGVESRLAIANSSLPGGNSQWNPGEDLLPTFQVGLPVRAQFRIFVDLYAISASAATAGASQDGEYLGSFVYTVAVDDQDARVNQLFIPLIHR